MKITLSGNIYEVGLQQTFDLFAEYLSGAEGGFVVAIGSTWPSGLSLTAIENSLQALGYGRNTCTYVATSPQSLAPLDAPALFALVEGLDPTCLIVLDEQATEIVKIAYRQTLATNAPARIFGRNAVVFEDFASLMEDDAKKQVAWALLKNLPRYGS